MCTSTSTQSNVCQLLVVLNNECSVHGIMMANRTLLEKSAILKILNKEILATCPTNEIEQEIEEAEDITSKIAEMLVEIDGRSQGKTKKISGEPCNEIVVHVKLNKDKLIKNMLCNEPKAHDKKGASAVPINLSDSSVEELLVKPKLPKMTLPRLRARLPRSAGFGIDSKPPFTITHRFQP